MSPRIATLWIGVAIFVAVYLCLCAALDGPSETDAARASALDLHDAIQQAQATRKEKP